VTVLVSLAPLIVLAVLFAFAIALLASSVRVLREYQRGVVFRLGRLLGDPKGPGLFLLIPIIDRMVQVDLRTITLVVPPQEVITRDNVPVRVNAVAYFRVVNPTAAIVEPNASIDLGASGIGHCRKLLTNNRAQFVQSVAGPVVLRRVQGSTSSPEVIVS